MDYPCGLARLTVVPHGQSTANALFARAAQSGDPAPAVAEETDRSVPPPALGLRQARTAGRWLTRLAPADHPSHVICPPCLRAVQTWDAIAAAAGESRTALPAPLTDERLRDRETGVPELLTPAAAGEHHPAESARRERVGEWFYRPPGGESLADVALRVRDFLSELHVNATGEHIMIIAHDAVVAAVQQVLTGIGAPPAGPTPVRNASLSQWDSDGTRIHLTVPGTTDHLEDNEPPAP